MGRLSSRWVSVGLSQLGALGVLTLTQLGGVVMVARSGVALPPPEDVPEEILRAEIILEARSPLNGEPLTAAEYAELELALADAEYAPTLNTELRDLIFLLRVRRMLRTFLPPLQLWD